MKTVRTTIQDLELIRRRLITLKLKARRDKRTGAAMQYGTAQGGLSLAINCLTKIRDYAPRD